MAFSTALSLGETREDSRSIIQAASLWIARQRDDNRRGMTRGSWRKTPCSLGAYNLERQVGPGEARGASVAVRRLPA
jgi:hypothetical protein